MNRKEELKDIIGRLTLEYQRTEMIEAEVVVLREKVCEKEQKIERLTEKIKNEESENIRLCNDQAYAIKECNKANEEIERLKKALKTHGIHNEGCGIYVDYYHKCTCGFEKILKDK